MAEWNIKNKEHNEMFDMWDTVQIWPRTQGNKHEISFSAISSPGGIQHDLWLTLEECRDFANYLLKACDKADYIKQIRVERRKERALREAENS